MRFARIGCAQRGGASSRPPCAIKRCFAREAENHPAGRGKTMAFWKNFMVAGGQRRSCQRIVRIRKYPSQTSESKGRAFDRIKATASAVLSGVLPPLLCVHLHSTAGIRAFGPCGRQHGATRSCPWHAEDCGFSFGFRRCGRGEGAGRRKGDVVGRTRCRADLPAWSPLLYAVRLCRRCGAGSVALFRR